MESVLARAGAFWKVFWPGRGILESVLAGRGHFGKCFGRIGILKSVLTGRGHFGKCFGQAGAFGKCSGCVQPFGMCSDWAWFSPLMIGAPMYAPFPVCIGALWLAC